jgi:hypothetical protein
VVERIFDGRREGDRWDWVGGCAGERRCWVAGGEQQIECGGGGGSEASMMLGGWVRACVLCSPVRIYFLIISSLSDSDEVIIMLGLSLRISFPMYSNQYFISRVISPQVKDHLDPN